MVKIMHGSCIIFSFFKFGSIRRGYTYQSFLYESQLHTHKGYNQPLEILVCGDFDFSYCLGLIRVTKFQHNITCCPCNFFMHIFSSSEVSTLIQNSPQKN